MAFAFSKINQALGLQEGDPQKQDIFGQQATDMNAVGGQQLGGNAGTQGLKTSTAGDIDAGGSGGGESAPGTAPAPGLEQSSTAGRAALHAAMGKTKTPKALGDVSSQIGAQDQALQQEADSYTSGQKAKQTYGVGNDDIEKAIGGDADASGKVKGLFAQQTVKPAEAFNPVTDVEVGDTQKLRSDTGLKELIGRGLGPNYNKGESEFDLRALRQTPDFDKTLREIEQSQEALRQKKLALAPASQKAVEDYGKTQLTAAQNAAKGYLTGQGDTIEKTNADQAAQATAKLDVIKRQGRNATKADVKAVLDELTAANGPLDPRVIKYVTQAAGVGLYGDNGVNLDQAKIAPEQFQHFRENPYTAADFYDTSEANRFNSIMGLLGRGDNRAAGTGEDPNAYSFDRGAYENAVKTGALGLRGKQDVLNQGDISSILASAQQRADAADQGWLGADSEKEAIRMADEARGAGSTFFDPSLLEAYNMHSAGNPIPIDPTAYYQRDTRDLGARDVLDDQEVQRLNALAEDTGLQDRYTKGGAALTSQASFDKQAYLNALRTKLADLRAGDQAGAPTAPGVTTPPPPGVDTHDPQVIGVGVPDPLNPNANHPVVPKKPEDIPGVGEIKDTVEGAGKGAKGSNGPLHPPVGPNIPIGDIAAKSPGSKEAVDKVGTTTKPMSIAEGVKKLSQNEKVKQFTANPIEVLKDVLGKGKSSQFAGAESIQDLRNIPGFWDILAKRTGFDSNTIDHLITAANSGKTLSGAELDKALQGAQNTTTAKKKATELAKAADDQKTAAKKTAAAAAETAKQQAAEAAAQKEAQAQAQFQQIQAQLAASAQAAQQTAQKAKDDAAAEAARAAGNVKAAGKNVANVLTGKKKIF